MLSVKRFLYGAPNAISESVKDQLRLFGWEMRKWCFESFQKIRLFKFELLLCEKWRWYNTLSTCVGYLECICIPPVSMKFVSQLLVEKWGREENFMRKILVHKVNSLVNFGCFLHWLSRPKWQKPLPKPARTPARNPVRKPARRSFWAKNLKMSFVLELFTSFWLHTTYSTLLVIFLNILIISLYIIEVGGF